VNRPGWGNRRRRSTARRGSREVRWTAGDHRGRGRRSHRRGVRRAGTTPRWAAFPSTVRRGCAPSTSGFSSHTSCWRRWWCRWRWRPSTALGAVTSTAIGASRAWRRPSGSTSR